MEKKINYRSVKNISLFQSYLQEFLQVRHTWDIPIKVHIPLNQALSLLTPQNYSPGPRCDLRRIPKCIFQDVLHDGTSSFTLTTRPWCDFCTWQLQSLREIWAFLPKEVVTGLKGSKTTQRGGVEKKAESDIKKEIPERRHGQKFFFWFSLLAKSVSGTDKIWDMCRKLNSHLP